MFDMSCEQWRSMVSRVTIDLPLLTDNVTMLSMMITGSAL